MLRKLSGFSTRRPVLILLAWMAIVGAGFGVGLGVFERLVGDVDTVPGSESDRAYQVIQELAPRPDTIAVVVSGVPTDDPALREDVRQAISEVRAMPGVAGVQGPTASTTTGQALLVQVALAPDGNEDATAQAAADRFARIAAPSVVTGGGPLQGKETGDQAQRDLIRAEVLTTPLLLILLLVVFAGFIAAGLPLVVAFAAVGGTFGVLYLFSTFTDISIYAIQITTTLAIGLAVDYALLIVSRFREERHNGSDVDVAIAATMATAGRTVMFSGLTVAVALAGLVVFPNPFLRSMGLAGSAVVLIDMLVAVTLLPALLAVFGKRISAKARKQTGTVFARIARAVQRRPLVTLLVAAGVMVFLALPVSGMRISAGDPRMMPAGTQTRALWDQLSVHFPERTRQSDIQVVAQSSSDDSALASLRTQVHSLPAVSDVKVEPLAPGVTLLRVSSTAPGDTVTAIRALDPPFEVAVTGTAARLADYHAMLAKWLPWAIGLVLLGTLALLFAFTGSLVLPIKAVLTNVLSLGAALGVVVWVFQADLGYVHLTVPVLIGAIAFGLSMDYEIFLLSRIRENWLSGASAHDSVALGLQRSGGIVTAAALILGVVFAGSLFGGFVPIRAIGLGLVLAVALDVTIVRMLVVPASMTLLGKHNWWLPRPLRRAHARLALAG